MNSLTTNEVSQRVKIFEPANKRLEAKRESEFSKFIKDEENRPAARKESHSKSADEKPNDEFKSATESDSLVKDQKINSHGLSDEPTDEAVENHFRLQLGLHEPVDDVIKLDGDSAIILTLPQSNPDSANELPTILETGFPGEIATDASTPAQIIPESEVSAEESNQAAWFDTLTTLDSQNDVPRPDLLTTELSQDEKFVPPTDSESTQIAVNQRVLPDPADSSQDTAEPVIQANDLSQTVTNANAVSATVSQSIAEESKPTEEKLESNSRFSGSPRGQNLAPVEPSPNAELEGELLPLDDTAEFADSNAGDNPWIEPTNSTNDPPSSSTNPLIDGIGTRPTEASSKPHIPYSPDVVKNITQTVTENLVQEAKFSENGSNKQLVVQLHPAELGQVVLQVDWDNDVLKGKIVASEMAASEILSQQKPHLIAALAESGLNFDSLDIAFKNTPHDQQESNRSQGSSEPSVHQEDTDPQSPTTDVHLNNPSESRIDLVA